VAIFHVTLWYDPRTLLPTRRVTKSDHGDVVTETYSEMTVDAELPDELFRMPEEKK
jgi:outer membrane lipoprotein-sorting protein